MFNGYVSIIERANVPILFQNPQTVHNSKDTANCPHHEVRLKRKYSIYIKTSDDKKINDGLMGPHGNFKFDQCTV